MTDPITRRGFGHAAAGALVFPTIVGAAALGRQQGKPAASERLTLGFIGVGTQNRGHLRSFLGRPECQVVAVCDVDTNRRESAQKMVDEKYGTDANGCAGHNDFRELVEDPAIDAVVIGTPDHWHVHPVMAAAKARKDIYCEKPLSLTIAEAKRMLDCVRKHEVVFQTGSQQRTEFDQKFRTACEAVRNGRIGNVQAVFVGVGPSSRPCDLPAEETEPGLDWDLWLGPAPERPYNSVLSPRGVHDHFPNWRAFREYSGGGYTDFGAHHYDIAQWGLGMDESGPVEITPPEDENAWVGCRYKYANGVEMIHGGPGGIVFIGDGGVISVDRDRLDASPKKILEEPKGEKDISLGKATDHHQDWLDCIKTRERPSCDVEIGARSVTVCHLGNLVYWHRQPLKWNPKKWEFTDGTGDPKWLDCDRRDPWSLPEV